MDLRRSLALSALLLAFPTAQASAATVAPPGNSGVDQYLESVPAAGGNQPPSARSQSGSLLNRTTAKAFNSRGSDGRAAAALAAQTAPPTLLVSPSRKPKSAGGKDPLPGVSASSASRSPAPLAAATVSSPATTGGGISPVLLIVLGLTTIGGLGVMLSRRRGSPPAA